MEQHHISTCFWAPYYYWYFLHIRQLTHYIRLVFRKYYSK
jgi:hypothetical protein